MKIFKKDGPRPLTKLEIRVKSFGTSDLIIWLETLLPQIGKAVVHHSRDGVESLVDAEKDAEVVLSIIRELKARMTHEF